MRPTSEEISWDIDGVPVSGTLTSPEGRRPYPGIVFVAGSGPTDRNWCSPLIPGTNCSGRLLAEVLTREGFATLRYDKRGSGPHAMENITRLKGRISMRSHLEELTGAVDTLLQNADVDPAGLFVLTSSEGVIHALHYQARAGKRRFAGLVLTGVPGRSVGQVARSQILAQVANLPNRDQLMNQYDAAIAAFVSGDMVTPDPSLPEGLRSLLLGLTNPVNLPFSRELWSTNPSELISKVKEPVMILIGKKDIQVDWKADGGALEQAVAGADNFTFVYPENADHVLKYEENVRDSIVAADVGANYNREGRILDPEALALIVNWLHEHTRK
jgi:alpha-beta hydrolase superfamily lysophospholipase